VAKPSRKTGWSSTHRILIGAADKGEYLSESMAAFSSKPEGPL